MGVGVGGWRGWVGVYLLNVCLYFIVFLVVIQTLQENKVTIENADSSKILSNIRTCNCDEYLLVRYVFKREVAVYSTK